MARSSQKQDDLCLYTLRLGFEGKPSIEIEMSGYLCDADGVLMEGADVWKGELRLTATEREFAHGSLLIVPCSTDDLTGSALTMEELLARQAFQPEFSPAPGGQEAVYLEIPEAVWRRWLASAESRKAEPEGLGDGDFWFY